MGREGCPSRSTSLAHLSASLSRAKAAKIQRMQDARMEITQETPALVDCLWSQGQRRSNRVHADLSPLDLQHANRGWWWKRTQTQETHSILPEVMGTGLQSNLASVLLGPVECTILFLGFLWGFRHRAIFTGLIPHRLCLDSLKHPKGLSVLFVARRKGKSWPLHSTAET